MENSQQAASLARRMAGKKGQTTQLQLEVNNEEEWEKLLAREGLIVIDVYSDWSGPCVGMIGNLKRAKVEFGGDSLILAIAKNDEIECLARFRNRSEPTWLFVAGGLLVNGMFGANAPKLVKMMEYELKKEQKVLKGEMWRQGNAFTELFEEEKDRLKLAEKMKSEAEKLEAERLARELDEKRTRIYTYMADHLVYETVLICFPHTIHPEGCVMLPDLEQFLRGQKMNISTQAKTVITRDLFDEIFYRGSLEPSDHLFEDLESGISLVLLLRSQLIIPAGQEGEKKPGDIEKIICAALNRVNRIETGQELVIPDPLSIPGKYPYVRKIREEGPDGEEEEVGEEVTSIPGCWTPASFLTKCAAMRFLFPVRADKVMMPAEEAIPAKIVIGFEVSKEKECFEILEEYPDDILNVGYFSSADATTAEPLCATPEQYAKLEHLETDRLVLVVKETKGEPLLSLAGLGAAYVSLDEKAGEADADLFFPPGVEPRYYKLEEAEQALLAGLEAEEEVEEEEAVEEEEEPVEQDEEDLMALLGLTV